MFIIRDLTHQEPEEKVWGYKTVYGSRIYIKSIFLNKYFKMAIKEEIAYRFKNHLVKKIIYLMS